MNRSKSIKAGMALLISLVGLSCSSQTTPATLPTSTPAIQSAVASSISSVRQGTVSPQQYLEDLIERMPQLRELQSSGLVDEILYDPSVSTLKAIYQHNLGKLGLDLDIDGLIADLAVSGVIKDDKFTAPSVFPPASSLYKTNAPFDIVLPQQFLYSRTISTDDDVSSVILHEARHIEDFMNGINYSNGISINKEDIGAEVSPDFFGGLLELRAHYYQMEGIFKANVGLSTEKYSGPFLIAGINNYAEADRFVRQVAKSPKEKSLLNAQLAEFPGMAVSKLTDGSNRIDISLYGFSKSFIARK